MKFALVNNDRVEATKGEKGQCPCCGSKLVAKCGEVKVNHWAHKGNRNCDRWWENETDWHRLWKGEFPIEWQEVIHIDDSGEKHIADVKTQSGWALEFQHSYLKPEERRSRNTFYTKLVWVVDGARRKTDKLQFKKILEESTTISSELLIKRVNFPDECRLLKEWSDSSALVFFDFQESRDTGQQMLWFLFPRTTSSEAYLSPFPRKIFIELHNNNKFDELVENIILPIKKMLSIKNNNEYSQSNRLTRFDRHMANKRRRRF